MFGFLGANGAGKTTTMRICLGIVRADAGEIRWSGTPVADLPRRTWGYLPEERGLYPRMAVLDQLVYFASLYGETPANARREALAWLDRFQIPDYADRRAEELSKGNQQKVQFIAAILHEPEVLLMDEPFTGLDPINLVILREAFMELRDQGRTLIFSTHQMEAAEALCESVAIVDRGRLVAGGRLRDLRRASGRRWIRIALEGPQPAPGLACGGRRRRTRPPRCRGSRPGAAGRCGSGDDPPGRSRSGRLGQPLRGPRPEPGGPVHRAGRPACRRRRRLGGLVQLQSWRRPRRRLMAARDPLLPNAGIIARREYRDRVRGPLYLASTVVLIGLALLVALAPIGIRYVDRGACHEDRGGLERRRPGPRDVIGRRSPVQRPAIGLRREHESPSRTWSPSIRIRRAADLALARGELDAVLLVERAASDGLDVVFRTEGPPDLAHLQTYQVVTFGLGVLDWNARRPTDLPGAPFVQPTFQVKALEHRPGCRQAAGSRSRAASRGFLGVVFVVLLFMSVVIYGMWVATGVAAEKSSRVMELMISAASPRQMLTGKVVGIGSAGLTQYVAIAVPALAVLALQDRIAEAVLGPGWSQGAPIVGLTPVLLAGYGVFFLLGFGLFALIYAAMGSFVSRPDDLQTLSLPLSLVAIVGYLTGDRRPQRRWRDVGQDRLVRPAVQPVRHARPDHGQPPCSPGSWSSPSGCWSRRSPSSRWWPSGCTRPACCCTASGPASGRSSRRRGGPARPSRSDQRAPTRPGPRTATG